jgi:hypothetical protein
MVDIFCWRDVARVTFPAATQRESYASTFCAPFSIPAAETTSAPALCFPSILISNPGAKERQNLALPFLPRTTRMLNPRLGVNKPVP